MPPLGELVHKYMYAGVGYWVDPFAGNSPFKKQCITNDLNIETEAEFHLEALEFLENFADNSVDGILYDPPYSNGQRSRSYQSVGMVPDQLTTSPNWSTLRKAECLRILKPGGIFIHCGWHTNALKYSDAEILEILILAHGGDHHDTITTVQRKRPKLF